MRETYEVSKTKFFGMLIEFSKCKPRLLASQGRIFDGLTKDKTKKSDLLKLEYQSNVSSNMKAKNPISVLDIYEWLPSYGENGISIVRTDSDLLVEILYDSEKSSTEERITINFFNTCFFSLSSFPGVDLMNIDYEKAESMSDLIEYKKSQAADKWSEQLPFYNKIRHYLIFFLSENKRLEIFSEGFKVMSKL